MGTKYRAHDDVQESHVVTLTCYAREATGEATPHAFFQQLQIPVDFLHGFLMCFTTSLER